MLGSNYCLMFHGEMNNQTYGEMNSFLAFKNRHVVSRECGIVNIGLCGYLVGQRRF